MKKTVVFFSSCALDGQGVPDPFMLQELPWLLAHFDRVLVCSYYGAAELTEPRPERVTAVMPAFAKLRAKLATPFCGELWRELRHLRRDGRLNVTNAVKLALFTMRGLMLQNAVEPLLRRDEQTTLYAYWLSYDGFAAALCKARHPEMRALARCHAFDIDVTRNAMNPYLMKRFMGETLDEIYPISRYAKGMLDVCAPMPAEKIHVVGMGSAGEAAVGRLPSPFWKDGTFHIVSCASVIAIKQVPLLIDALAMWTEQPIDWLHIGGGADEDAARAYAREKLGANVRWEITGTLARERVAEIYATRAFDLFVNTSLNEGVPVSIMEAMRVGLPIVAPKVGGIPELVDESFGRMYEGGAEAALAAMRDIASMPKQAVEAMREAAQQRWNDACRSDALLPLIFPEEARGTNA